MVSVKVIKKHGFLYATFSMNNVNEENSDNKPPYCLVNNLNREITFQQKEIPDEDMINYLKQSNS